MKIAIVTGADYAELGPPERALVEALIARGIACAPAIWSDDTVRWDSFDAALIRTPWDYHEQPRAFAAWLDALERAGVRLVNPVPTVRWNMHKSYLRALAERGVALPRTVWIERSEPGAPAEVLSRLDHEARATFVAPDTELVVKPAVSAGAFETFRTTLSALKDDRRVTALRATRDIVIQEYCAGIATRGELSFVFVGGTLTHAVIKKPAVADFRVQERFGGVSMPLAVTPAQRLAAEAVIAAAHGAGYAFTYARVDMVEHAGRLRLMELELIEPSLYLEIVPAALDAVADGLAHALHQT